MEEIMNRFKGLGIDPTSWSREELIAEFFSAEEERQEMAVKLEKWETDPDSMLRQSTDAQVKLFNEMDKLCGDKVEVAVGFDTFAETNTSIAILAATAVLVAVLRTKEVSKEQTKAIKAKLATKPTIEWVLSAATKAATLPNKGS
jgi:hypothetical protein